MTTRFRALPALALALLATAVSGCGPSLIARASNPFGYGCGIVWLVLAVMALLDIWKSSRTDSDKVIWTAVIVFIPVAGSLAYYLFGRK